MGRRPPKDLARRPAHYEREKARDKARYARQRAEQGKLSNEHRRVIRLAKEAGKAFARGVKQAWREATETKRRHGYGIKSKYGIDIPTYDAMLVAQAGGCAICGGANLDGRKLFVDHDHDTGAVRALLCHHCNAGLGHFKDTPDRLRLAAAYLERYKCA